MYFCHSKPVHLWADRFSESNPDRTVSLSERVCVFPVRWELLTEDY